MPTLRDLIKQAKRIFPNSKAMRKQWVRKTAYLHQTGRAAILNGGWVAGTRSQLLTKQLGNASTEMAALVATTTTACLLIGHKVSAYLMEFYTVLLGKLGG